MGTCVSVDSLFTLRAFWICVFCSGTRRRSRQSGIGLHAAGEEREAEIERRKKKRQKTRTVMGSRHRILRGERERGEDQGHHEEIIPEAQGAGEECVLLHGGMRRGGGGSSVRSEPPSEL